MRIVSLLVLMAACSADPKPEVVTPIPAYTPVPVPQIVEPKPVPMLVPAYDAVADQRHWAEVCIEEGNYICVAENLWNLYNGGNASKEEFEVAFDKALANLSSLNSGLSVERWLEEDRKKALPYAERYYARMIVMLKQDGAIDFARRGSFSTQWFGCNDNFADETSIVSQMAVLAKALGRTKDDRTWKIHHADIVAADLRCEGCGDFIHYDLLAQAYQEYLDLGLTSDAKKHALQIAKYYEGDYYDDTACSHTDLVHCHEELLDPMKEWYLKAGWSASEVEGRQSDLVKVCLSEYRY